MQFLMNEELNERLVSIILGGVSGNVSRARSPIKPPIKRCYRRNSMKFSNSNLADMGKMANEFMTHII